MADNETAAMSSDDAIFRRIQGEWQGTAVMVAAKCRDQAQNTMMCCADTPLSVNVTLTFSNGDDGSRKLNYAYTSVISAYQSTGYFIFQPTFAWTTNIGTLIPADHVIKGAFLMKAANTIDSSFCMHVQATSADSMIMAVRVRPVYSPGHWGNEYYCSRFLPIPRPGGCTRSTVWPDMSRNHSWPLTGSWHDSIITLTKSSRSSTNVSIATPPSTIGTDPGGSTAVAGDEKDNSTVIALVVVGVAVFVLLVALALARFWCRASRRARAAPPDPVAAAESADEQRTKTPSDKEKVTPETPETRPDAFEGTENMGKSVGSEGQSKDTTMWGCDVQIVVQGMREHWLINRDDVVVDNDVIDQGGFGDVRTGLLYNSTKVAVKTCLSSQKDDNSRRNTWLALANEMRLLRRTRHPNIVLFFGIVVLPGGRVGLILEWVEGMNLKGYTQKCGQRLCLAASENTDLLCMPNHKRKLLIDVGSGMQFLHAQKPPIIHRDLKPANVLVEMVATPPRAKITDFGVSVLLEGDDVQGRSGTKAYMAPEVVAGKQYNVSADVFSFGCTFAYTFLTKLPDRTQLKEEIAETVYALGAPKTTVSMIKSTLAEESSERPDFAKVRSALEKWVEADDLATADRSSESSRSMKNETATKATMSL